MGQGRNQQPNTPQGAKPNNQPMWVRPGNGPNWMRNPASNTNTNFLNNERGGMVPNMPSPKPNSIQPIQSQRGGNGAQAAHQNTPNQMPNSNKPSQVVNSGQPVAGGGGKNSNNNNNDMKGLVPTGSMISKSDVLNQNTNDGSNVKNTGDVEDYELREFSEELLLKDSNNAARFVTVNLQGMTTSRSTNDEAPLP